MKHCASGVKRKKKRRYNKIRDMTYEDESEDIECFNKWQ